MSQIAICAKCITFVRGCMREKRKVKQERRIESEVRINRTTLDSSSDLP